MIGGSEIYTLALPAPPAARSPKSTSTCRRDDDDALAPMLDESWLGVTGDWQDSRSGLRYRFHSYRRS